MPQPPLTAIILAAGAGSRFKDKGIQVPKPLIRLGGLTLLERAIRTAAKAGASKFLVILGQEAETIRGTLENRLQDFSVRWIVNESWEAGNGTSVLAAKPFVDRQERVLILMADHLLFVPTLRRLLAAAASRTETLMAVDKKVSSVMDVADATKVRLQGERVVELNKSLDPCDALDIGAAVYGYEIFTALEEISLRQPKSCSHSDGMRSLINKNLLLAYDIGEDRWEDVDSPDAHKVAERLLFSTLRKPTDGFMSRHLERRLSILASRLLMNTPVTPNQVTIAIMMIGALSAWFFSQPGETAKIIGSLIFWASSVLDGTDGELSRMKLMETRLGGWLDLWSDNVVHILVFMGMGIGLFRDWHEPLWLYLGLMASVGVLFSVSWVSWTITRQKRKAGPLYTGVTQVSQTEKPWVVRLTEVANTLSRRDFIFGVIFLAILGWLPHFLWAAAIGSNLYWMILVVISVGQGLRLPTR